MFSIPPQPCGGPTAYQHTNDITVMMMMMMNSYSNDNSNNCNNYNNDYYYYYYYDWGPQSLRSQSGWQNKNSKLDSLDKSA